MNNAFERITHEQREMINIAKESNGRLLQVCDSSSSEGCWMGSTGIGLFLREVSELSLGRCYSSELVI